MILPRLDLPAPFSPTSACTVPAAISTSMLSRMRVPPKLLATPRTLTAMAGVVMGVSRTARCRWPGTLASPARMLPWRSAFPLGLEIRVGVEPLLVDDHRVAGLGGRVDPVLDRLALLGPDQRIGGVEPFRERIARERR